MGGRGADTPVRDLRPASRNFTLIDTQTVAFLRLRALARASFDCGARGCADRSVRATQSHPNL